MHCIQEVEGKLCWVQADSPRLEPGCLKIKVAATAVNRADLVQRQGQYPPPPGASEILGLECSGRVVEVCDDEDDFQVGDKVVALLSGGGYAEEVVVPRGQVLPLPAGLSLHEGAALPEVFATAWLNLRLEGELKEQERVLIHAAGSGVGTAAVQLCAAWGNPVVGSLRSPEKVQQILDLGALAVVNTKEQDWPESAASHGGFDLILDPIGGSLLESNVRLLNLRGRLVNIGLMGGAAGTLPLGRLLMRRLTIKGSVLRSRSTQDKSLICDGLKQEVWPLLECAKVRPIIDSIFPIQEAEAAHQKVASNQTVGKVVLRLSD